MAIAHAVSAWVMHFEFRGLDLKLQCHQLAQFSQDREREGERELLHVGQNSRGVRVDLRLF